MSESSKGAVSSLMDLGFDEAQVKSALQSTGGNVEQAANLLFSPPPSAIASTGNPFPNSSFNPPNIVIQGSMSQYDLPEGRSACSCIALAGARTFLQDSSSLLNANTTNPQRVLDEIVQQGHAIYIEWKSSLLKSTTNNSTEHTAPEDVLPLFPQLQLDGTVRQGMLQSDAFTTWHSVLSSCRSDEQWTAVVVTKPPETVLVLFSTSQFWLIDSHSRPPQTTAASAMCYDSLPSLCQALSDTFPATMIQDVPDTMLLMYNSFDLYPLRLR